MKALLEQEIPSDHKFRLWGTAINEPPAFAAFGVKIIGWWGMTETITHGIVGEIDQPNIPMSIAAPRRNMKSASPTTTGGRPKSTAPEISIKGIVGLSLFAAYLHNEKATRESF